LGFEDFLAGLVASFYFGLDLDTVACLDNLATALGFVDLIGAAAFFVTGFLVDLTATDLDLIVFFYANALAFGFVPAATLLLPLPIILLFVAGFIFPLAKLFLSLYRHFLPTAHLTSIKLPITSLKAF
jgi:hypothetical protein